MGNIVHPGKAESLVMSYLNYIWQWHILTHAINAAVAYPTRRDVISVKH